MIEMRPEGSFLREGFLDYCDYLKKNNVKKILEIGSYAGESIRMMKEVLGEDVMIVAIDPWDELIDDNDLINETDLSLVEEAFNAETLSVKNLVKCKYYSQDIVDLFKDEYFDCLYVDGLHTYEQVKLDLELFTSKVKQGGVISGHDYLIKYTDKQREEIIDFDKNHKLRLEVSRAVNEVVGLPHLTFVDSSWAIIK